MGEPVDSPGTDDFSDIYASPACNELARHSPQSQAMDLRSKRKLTDEDLQVSGKRLKTEEHPVRHFPELLPVAGLPAEIWQNIFKQLHPLMLGRLMQVNRAFYRYLSDTEAHRWLNPRKDRLQVLDSEIVWSESRKHHCPKMPRPLINCHEKDMWKLILGQGCMLCSKILRARSQSDKFFENGPGSDGLRIVWPFAVRTCGSCLERHSQKETTLLFSSSSALLPALPFAFVTQDLHVVPSIALQDSGGLPPTVRVTKFYYKPHVEEIERQLRDTQALGPAAAEEWGKGLAATGKERLLDAARWERFETRGGVDSIVVDVRNTRAAREMSAFSYGQSSPRSTLTPSSASGIRPVSRSIRDTSIPYSISHPSRTGRDLRDINQSKALRRAEIERRCELLQPPLTRNVLQFMESFQAAVQIPMALTENAWDLLLPRLLAQKPDAEKLALEAATKGRASVARSDRRGPQNVDSKEADVQGWEELQTPVRNCLARCADTIITEGWQNGSTVTNANCPSFAADVLLGSRQLYLSEQPCEDTSAFSRRSLVLDNMKWIFDTKIRPVTEKFRREIFLCNDCTTNKKFYGFEAVIQHYGAKHTNSFSIGNTTVSWREAEWPEHPPFNPNPGRLPNTGRCTRPPHDRNPWNANKQSQLMQQKGVANPTSHEISPSPRPFGAPQVSPGPNRGASLPYNSNWMPPTSLPHPGHYATHTRPPGLQMQYSGLSQIAPVPSYASSQVFDHVPPQHTGSQHHGHAIGPVMENCRPNLQPVPASRLQNPRQGGWYPETLRDPTNFVQDSPSRTFTTLTQREVDTLSEVACDVWFLLAGVKDLPTSLRVYIVIFHMEQSNQAQFGHGLDLDLFEYVINSGLNTAPIRNAPGLACKMCALQRDGQQAGYQSYYSRIDRRHLYNLSSLVTHFKQTHASEPNAIASYCNSRSDWKRLMIELPEPEFIEGFENAPGMDAEQKQLFLHVFPSNHGFRRVPRPTQAPYDGKAQRDDVISRHDGAEAIGNHTRGGSGGAFSSLRHSDVWAKVPTEDGPLYSVPDLRAAELGDERSLVPEVPRCHTSDFQYQEGVQEAPRKRPVIYTEDENGQRTYRIIRESQHEYRRLPPERFVYVQDDDPSFRSTLVFEDTDLPHKTNGDRAGASTTSRKENAHSIQYISRSKDWSPTEDEHSVGVAAAEKDPSELSANVELPRRHLVQGNNQRASRISDTSETFRSTQYSPNAGTRDWIPTPSGHRLPGIGLQVEPRSALHSETQSWHSSGLPTPTRVNEHPPQAMTRASSRRFGRYEATRRHLDRTASQSPAAKQSVFAQDASRREVSPTQPKQPSILAQDDRPYFVEKQLLYDRPSSPREEEGHEYVMRVPAEASEEQDRPLLIRRTSDRPYDLLGDNTYYDTRLMQGGRFLHHRADSPQERMREQQRIIYVPEREGVPIERVERFQEDTRASAPPDAAL
ncbi:hypothetical protein EV356DRAFT_332412 [Viridothelium virens]|uniref:F-box domain-containing protein n=1 Tax=Viridothelium virens TaxID=1048519 RepID=A0A6A6HIL7_VIRVR|nr:hypothetical protein EV356DRAFT_332412 [Viridothelium virens]